MEYLSDTPSSDMSLRDKLAVCSIATVVLAGTILRHPSVILRTPPESPESDQRKDIILERAGITFAGLILKNNVGGASYQIHIADMLSQTKYDFHIPQDTPLDEVKQHLPKP